MTDTPEVEAARIRAEQSKEQFMETLHELQHRLAPKTLAQNAWEGARNKSQNAWEDARNKSQDAWEEARNKSADLAEDAVDAVRKRPVAAGGIVAGIALFLARHSLWKAGGRLVGGKSNRNEEEIEIEEVEIVR